MEVTKTDLLKRLMHLRVETNDFDSVYFEIINIKLIRMVDNGPSRRFDRYNVDLVELYI